MKSRKRSAEASFSKCVSCRIAQASLDGIWASVQRKVQPSRGHPSIAGIKTEPHTSALRPLRPMWEITIVDRVRSDALYRDKSVALFIPLEEDRPRRSIVAPRGGV